MTKAQQTRLMARRLKVLQLAGNRHGASHVPVQRVITAGRRTNLVLRNPNLPARGESHVPGSDAGAVINR
jgi:hypothetical protein